MKTIQNSELRNCILVRISCVTMWDNSLYLFTLNNPTCEMSGMTRHYIWEALWSIQSTFTGSSQGSQTQQHNHWNPLPQAHPKKLPSYLSTVLTFNSLCAFYRWGHQDPENLLPLHLWVCENLKVSPGLLTPNSVIFLLSYTTSKKSIQNVFMDLNLSCQHHHQLQ